MQVSFSQGTIKVSVLDSQGQTVILETTVAKLAKGQGIPGNFPLRLAVEFPFCTLGETQCRDGYGFKLHGIALTPCTLISATWTGHAGITAGSVVFFNGYQSWTDSAEAPLYKHSGAMGILGKLFENKYHFTSYGDYNFTRQSKSAGAFHGWTYFTMHNAGDWALLASTVDDGAFTSFHCKAHFLLRTCARLATVLPSFARVKGHIPLVIGRDVEGRTMEPGALSEAMDLLSVVLYTGTEDGVFDQWFADVGKKPLTTEPCRGWTSWYKYYEDIDAAKIEKVLLGFEQGYKSSGAQTVPVFQIDDGWQTRVGDWLSVRRTRFPQGMGILAHKVRVAGMCPGLWLAPFAAHVEAELAKQHPEWLVHDQRGKPIMAGSNWGGFYGLDILLPQVQDYLKTVFVQILDTWGYEMVKLDFLYATCMVPRKGLSRGEIMAFGMKFLRGCVGTKKILACGVPLASAFGLVDYCRIGCDVGLDWDGPLVQRFIHRERVSTKNSLANTHGRRQLNSRVFLNDPDVWIGRSSPDVILTAKQKKQLHDDNIRYGGLVFCSDDWDEIPIEWRKL